MKLESEFIQLPYHFDQKRLAYEVNKISLADWMPHPSKLAGNFSCPLISVNGECNDLMSGEMLTTQYLEKMPYIRQIMETIGEIYGRSRLMLLKAGCQVVPHHDLHYHWFNRVRIHIPITTNPGVIFKCADKAIHMDEGSTWIFDSWKKHSVFNNSNHDRVHLVLDTCGSFKFWKVVEQLLQKPIDNRLNILPYLSKNKNHLIKTEKFNVNELMSAGEVDFFISFLIEDVTLNSANDPIHLNAFVDVLLQFQKAWRNTWLQYGNEIASRKIYQQLIDNTDVENNGLKLNSNGCDAKAAFYALLLGVAINNQQTQKSIKKNSEVDISLDSSKTDNLPQKRNSPCVCGSQKKYKYCCG
ncbi:MAG: hypothetical protein ACJAS9_000486 [Polaribacter sp.]|jgi:hypothetical protein